MSSKLLVITAMYQAPSSRKKENIPIREAASRFGYSTGYLSNLCRTGKVIGTYSHNGWLVDAVSLERFVKNQAERKEARARELAKARAEEYKAQRSAQTPGAGQFLISNFQFSKQFPIFNFQTIFKPNSNFQKVLRSEAFAVVVAVLLVGGSAVVARGALIPQVAESVFALASETADGFRETFGDMPGRITARVGAARSFVGETSARVAIVNEVATASIAPEIYNLQFTISKQFSNPNFQFSNARHLASVGDVLAPSITVDDMREFANGALAIIVSPEDAYRAVGMKGYGAIANAFAAYRALVEASGARALALAASTRDAYMLAIAPLPTRLVAGLGEAVIGATHAVIRAEVSLAYGTAAAAPATARATVALIGNTGDLLARATERVPALATAAYLRVVAVPAELAPALASAVFDAEYRVALPFARLLNRVEQEYLALIKDASSIAYDGGQRIYNLQFTISKQFLIPEFSNLASAVQDAYLGALGHLALALESQTYQNLNNAIASMVQNPQVATVLTALVPRSFSEVGLSPAEEVALATYETLHGWFSATTDALASLFSPTPVVVLPTFPPKTVAVATSTPKTPVRQTAPAPAPAPAPASYYVTNLNGVSVSDVNQLIADARTRILATVAGMVQPVANQTVQNIQTIQLVNKIEDLTDLIVRNGDFRGGTLIGASNVTGTNATFSNLTASTLTASALTSGTIAATGALTSYTSATAPYFVATSTTATSTFAGGLTVGTDKLVVDSTTGYVGIGTTTPLSALAVSGGASIGANYNFVPPTNGLIIQGNLGIGTTTPSSALAVSGDFFLTGSTTVTGAGSGLTFTGTGNHDITAQGGTLRIGSNTIIGNIEALDDTVDIGTAATRFDKIYANEVNASTIVGTLTGGNLTAETFSINSDNASDDTENAYLSFERGTVSPNALLSWNSAESAKRLEFNHPLFLQDASASTTNITLSLQSVAGQTGDVFRIASSSSATTFLTVTGAGNVGIGTSSPLSRLSIQGGGATSATSALNVTDSNGASKLFVRNDGNVGIGTTAPGYPLAIEVPGADATTPTLLYLKQSATNGAPGVAIAFNAGLGTTARVVSTRMGPLGEQDLSLETNGLKRLTVSYDGNVSIPTATATTSIAGGLTVGTSQFVVQHATGNVGIGTTSPVSKLSVVGESAFAGGASVGLGYAGTAAPTGGLIIQGNVGIGTTSPVSKLSVVGESAFAGGASVGIGYAGTAAPTGGMIIQGNVGIGTTNPGAKLDVLGDINVDGGYRVKFVNGTNYLFARDEGTGTGINESFANYLRLGTGFHNVRIYDDSSSTVPLVNLINGNVGIGTTSPSSLLSVHGNAYVSGTSFFGGAITGTSTLAITGTGDSYILGNVGIGTTSPSAKLEVNRGGSSGAGILNLSGNDSNYTYYGIGRTALEGSWSVSNTSGTFLTDSAAGDSVITTSSITKKLLLGTGNGASTMTINNGNVGIGTTSPNHLLHLSGTSSGIAVDVSSGTGNGAIDFMQASSIKSVVGIAGTTNGGVTGSVAGDLFLRGNSQSILFSTNSGSTGHMIIKDGNVGIGTTTPRAKLDVWGNLNVGTSSTPALFVDTASGNVGIGTTSPLYGLDVYNSRILINYPSAANDTDTIGFQERFGTDATLGQLFFSIKGHPSATGSSRYVSLSSYDSSANRNLVLQPSSGNVGIGTTDPAQKLHVVGRTDLGLVGTTGQYVLSLNPDTAGNTIFSIVNGASGFENKLRIVGGANPYSPSAEYLTIQNTGNVGIGTTSPGATLAVASGATALNSIFDSTNAQGAYIKTSASGVGSLYLGSLKALRSNEPWAATDGGITAGGVLNLAVNGNVAAVDAMTILTSGNVGIGTTSPLADLHMSSLSNTNLMWSDSNSATDEKNWDLLVNATKWQGRLVNDANDAATTWLEVERSGTTVTDVSFPNGNVGIGTTSPTNGRLQVLGAAGAFAVRVDGNATAGSSYGLGIYAGTNSGDDAFRVHTQSGTELFRIRGDGNVGIGTTNPGAKLEVAGKTIVGSSSSEPLEVYSSGDTEIGFSYSTKGNIYGKIIGDVTVASPLAGEIAFQTATGGSLFERMRITSNGNVGIGTTEPGAPLEIAYGSNPDGNVDILKLFGSAGSGAGEEFRINWTTGSRYMGYIGMALQTGTSDSYMAFSTRESDTVTEKVRIDKDGNVGIGTTTPAAKLHISVASSETGVRVQNNNTFVTRYADFGFDSSTDQGYINFLTAGSADRYFDFRYNGASKMVLTPAGNVGIGTTSPDTKLVVDLGKNDTSATYNLAKYFVGGGQPNAAYLTISGTTHSTASVRRIILDAYQNDGTSAPLILQQSTGNVGIGTTSPTNGRLQVLGAAGAFAVRVDGNATAGSSYGLGIYAGTNSGDDAFRVHTQSGTELFRIRGDGNVGIGTTSPSSLLSLSNNLNTVANTPLFTIASTTGGASTSTLMTVLASGNVGIGTTNPNEGKLEVKGGTVCVDTDSNDTATSCIANESDARLKTNVLTIGGADALAQIGALRPVSFDWKYNDPEVLSNYPLIARFALQPHSIGLIAQEAAGVVPEAIMQETLGLAGYLQLDYTKLVPVLLAGVKELDARQASTTAVLAEISPQLAAMCVTGDTKLRVRRRKKSAQRDGNLGTGTFGIGVDDWEYLTLPIAEVLSGDEVLSLNERTGTLEYRQVAAVVAIGVQEVFEIVTRSGRKIRTTSNHPFLARDGATQP